MEIWGDLIRRGMINRGGEEEVNEITNEWERGFVKGEGKMNSSISWHLRRASGFRDSPRQPVGRSITTGMRSLALKVISSRARSRSETSSTVKMD